MSRTTHVSVRVAAALVVACSTLVAHADTKVEPLSIDQAIGAQSFQAQGVVTSISPDSEWVLSTVCDPQRINVNDGAQGMVATQDAAAYSMGCDLWLYSLTGGKQRQLTRDAGNNWSPSWSPDGQMIAFHSDRDGKAGVWLWDRALDSFRKVTDEPTRHMMGFTRPNVSRWHCPSRCENRRDVAAHRRGQDVQQRVRALRVYARGTPIAARRTEQQSGSGPVDLRSGHETDATRVDDQSGIREPGVRRDATGRVSQS